MQQAQQHQAQVQQADEHAGCWLDSSLDLHQGLEVREELDMCVFELFVMAAAMPQPAVLH